MPTVHLIPVKVGMEPDEIVGRLQGGWQLLGRQMVKRGAAVATPSSPEGRFLENADVWMLAEPMIPLAMVATMVLEAAAEYESGDAISCLDPLECVAHNLFGMDLASLRTAVEEAMNAQGQNPS